MDDYVPPAQYNVFMVDGFMKLILTDLVIHTLACMGHKDRSKHVRLALRGAAGRGLRATFAFFGAPHRRRWRQT